MQPIVLGDVQASSPWQLSLYTKHHMAFLEGEGMNRAEKSTFVCGDVCLCMGRWKHGALPPGHGFYWPHHQQGCR